MLNNMRTFPVCVNETVITQSALGSTTECFVVQNCLQHETWTKSGNYAKMGHFDNCLLPLLAVI